MLIWVKFESGKKKQYDSDKEKEKTQKKTAFQNDSNGAIPDCVKFK